MDHCTMPAAWTGIDFHKMNTAICLIIQILNFRKTGILASFHKTYRLFLYFLKNIRVCDFIQCCSQAFFQLITLMNNKHCQNFTIPAVSLTGYFHRTFCVYIFLLNQIRIQKMICFSKKFFQALLIRNNLHFMLPMNFIIPLNNQRKTQKSWFEFTEQTKLCTRKTLIYTILQSHRARMKSRATSR